MTQFRGCPRFDGEFRQLFAEPGASADFEAGLEVRDLASARHIRLCAGDREFVAIAVPPARSTEITAEFVADPPSASPELLLLSSARS